jgi:HK97 family phage major capsid protein
MANTAQLLKEARERRADALTKIKGYGEKIQARTWAEDADGPALSAAQAELIASEKDVERLEMLVDVEARSAGWTSTSTPAPAFIKSDTLGDNGQKASKRYSMLGAIRAASGQGKLEGFEKEMHEEAVNEMRAAGISNYGQGVLVPQLLQQRDMLAGTTTAGGYTIQTDVDRLIPFLDPQGVLSRLGVTFMGGLSGNIDFPRNDAAAAAVWEAEQGAADETNPTFDRVQMSPKRLAAFTEISMQVLRQSTISMENFVRNRLMNARDNALDTAALSPQSGSAPTGIIGTSGVNTVTIAASPTWGKILQFETEISADNAAFGNLAYLTTPQVAGILKQAKRDVAGNGFIWEGGNTGQGSINGYRALTSTLVPTSGGAHYMFFGNWSKLMLGQWGGMEITTDPYTRLKEATVQVVLNTWHDMAIEHGQAFAYSANVHPS